jgi:predicted dehydrogenase
MPARTWRRRDLLRLLPRAAAAAAGAALAPRAAARAAGPVSPSEQIGVGIIGVGDLGRNHHLPILLGRPRDFRVLALCDVDRSHLEQALARTEGKARGYHDFRDLLEQRDLDAVLIATPDHWHAIPALQACQAGKDVYCEKPLTYCVEEGRALLRAVRRYGRVFQTGSQQRSDWRFRWACELARNGRIGRLERVQAALPPGPSAPWEPPAAAPPELDWNFWLGPAPWAEYTPKRCHWTFRWFHDYSGGTMTDWGAHHNDIAQWGIGADGGGPIEVEGKAEFPASGLYQTALHFDVRYRYAGGIELRVTSRERNGVTFFGSAGRVFVTRGAIEADPPEILDTPPGAGPIPLEESDDHHGNWAECIRARRRPICDVEVGHRSVSVCHIGNIAIQLGRKLRWDPVAERFPEDEEANRLLWRPMRRPWSL